MVRIWRHVTGWRSWSYDVTDDVITYNHCRNFGAKYLGNEVRLRDGFNVQWIGTCLWSIDCACSRWRHVTGWRHNGDVTFFFFKMLLLRQFLSELDDTWTHGTWSSRIGDPGRMTLLMTSSRIIIVAHLEQNISETSCLAHGIPASSALWLVRWPRRASHASFDNGRHARGTSFLILSVSLRR